MKKFLSIFMALAMVLAMSITAFAAESTNVTINGGIWYKKTESIMAISCWN